MTQRVFEKLCTKFVFLIFWPLLRGLLGGFSVEASAKPVQGPLLGDSVQIPGVCPAVTPTFGQ